jgi:hypothetical protein
MDNHTYSSKERDTLNTPHTNYDLVLKDALTLFKDKTLDFLGLSGIAPISESLSTESVEIEVKWEFQDLAFATQDGRGVNLEEEIDLSYDDLLRILGYNVTLSRTHKREFVTVIFAKNTPKQTEIKTEQIHFAPKIVDCSKIDADAMIAKLKAAINSGQVINELEAIYLPLFSSKTLSPTELFLESAEIVKVMQASEERKRKVLSLLITLSGKIVDHDKILELIEEVYLFSCQLSVVSYQLLVVSCQWTVNKERWLLNR